MSSCKSQAEFRLFALRFEPLDATRVTRSSAQPIAARSRRLSGWSGTTTSGRRVLCLDYECYEPLAVKAFERIAARRGDEWPAARLAIEHRIGRLQIGEASVVIAAGSPHRADAFAACRYAIERIKQIAPIWKQEFFEGGDVWIEGATADPDDEDARREALARACA